MKLDRCAIFTIFFAVFATGCGTRAPASPAVAAAPAPTVATTRLMAADLRDTDDAPKVGKSQHSSSLSEDEVELRKDAPHRRDDRRPGGGFSGYK